MIGRREDRQRPLEVGLLRRRLALRPPQRRGTEDGPAASVEARSEQGPLDPGREARPERPSHAESGEGVPDGTLPRPGQLTEREWANPPHNWRHVPRRGVGPSPRKKPQRGPESWDSIPRWLPGHGSDAAALDWWPLSLPRPRHSWDADAIGLSTTSAPCSSPAVTGHEPDRLEWTSKGTDEFLGRRIRNGVR